MDYRENRNIVLTGPGRSGTTLTCHLLNKLPGMVALAEPIPRGEFLECMPDKEAICDRIQEFYREMRAMALDQGVVVSKHVDGVEPDNTKGDAVDGVRHRLADHGTIAVNKELGPDFCLAVKQPGLFTALTLHSPAA